MNESECVSGGLWNASCVSGIEAGKAGLAAVVGVEGTYRIWEYGDWRWWDEEDMEDGGRE